MFRRLAALLVTLLAIQWATTNKPAAAEDDAPNAEFEIDQLRQAMRLTTEQLRSFHVKYRLTGYPGNVVPDGFYVERTIAVRSPDWLFTDAGHGHDAMHWTDDPYRQTAYVTPDELINVYPIDRAFLKVSLNGLKSLPGSLDSEFFFFATGIWPLTKWQPPRPNGQPHMLVEIIEDDQFVKIRDKQEKIGNDWCHVLARNDTDVIWLDVSHGCCIRQREFYDQSSGNLVARIVCREIHEVDAGVWLPKFIDNNRFDFNATTAEGRNRKLVDSTVEILEFQVGELADETFSFTPQPGALLVDPDDITAAPEQVLAGGIDHLESTVDWIKRHGFVQPHTNDQTSSSAGSQPWPAVVMSMIGGVCIIVGCEFLMRRGRRRFE